MTRRRSDRPCRFRRVKKKNLNTWDRLLLPMPFSRGLFVYGEPVLVGRTADGDAMERARLALEQALNAVTDRAESQV